MLKTHPVDSDRGAAQVAPLIQVLGRTFCVALAACTLWALVCPWVPVSAATEAQPGAAYTEPYFEYQSDTYGIGISLDPVFIDYLSVDLDGDGEFRELLAYVGKPSSLWLGVVGNSQAR